MEEKSKKKGIFKKLVLAILIIIALFLIFGGWKPISLWLGQSEIDRLVKRLEKFEQEQYRKMLADTYGGKTPQETLQMYIEAVEKGDYELASKYFIENNRDKELKSFEGAMQVDIQNVVNLLKESLSMIGQYSVDGKEYVIDKPIYVRMILFPNGIWKLVEI